MPGDLRNLTGTPGTADGGGCGLTSTNPPLCYHIFKSMLSNPVAFLEPLLYPPEIRPKYIPQLSYLDVTLILQER